MTGLTVHYLTYVADCAYVQVYQVNLQSINLQSFDIS